MLNKKSILQVLSLSCILLCFTGCSSSSKDDMEEVAACNRDGRYFMTEEGIYLEDENDILRYFDFHSKTTVVVCDKAECEHKPAEYSNEASCNGQINSEQLAVYHDKIYYLTGGEQYNTTQLRCRDMDGNNDSQVAVFRGNIFPTDTSTCFYRNKLMAMTEISSGDTFNAETKEAQNSTFVLSCIDLETGNCDVVQESTGLLGFGYSIYKAEDGKFFYYSTEKEGFFSYDPEDKTVTELQVPCTVKIGVEEEGNGINHLYHFAYGDYCYGVGGEGTDCDRVLKTGIETGEEESIYQNEEVYYVNYQDFLLIIDYSKGGLEDIESREFYLFDIKKQELVKLQNSFLSEPGMSIFDLVSEDGVLFSWAVHKESGQRYYDGDFEYRYMTMEDLLEGKDDYTSVYYLSQE